MADTVESALQIDIDHAIKCLFAHARQQAVTRDTSVIDQNINAAPHCLHLGDFRRQVLCCLKALLT